MDLFNVNDLKELAAETEYPAITIFIPTHRSGDQFQQDRIRFKNQLQKVEKELEESAFRSNEIADLLKPAKELLESKDFWFQQSDGLAVFLSKSTFKTYRFPLNSEEFSIINKRFYIKPLLPLLSGDGRFLLLTLDLKNLKLYEGSRYSLSELELPKGIPLNFNEAMKYDDPEKSLQFHTGAPSQGGGKNALFHGHGSGTMDDSVFKEKILEFFHMAEKGIHEKIKDETAPLLLAGLQYLIPIYKKTCSYPHLIDRSLNSDTDNFGEDELHKKAWEIIEPIFKKDKTAAWNKYNELITKEKATNNIEEIVKNSYANRIEALFINPEAHAWGNYDSDTNEVKVYSDNKRGEDLIDLAAVQTTLNGGIVYSLNPSLRKELDAAAVYRY